MILILTTGANVLSALVPKETAFRSCGRFCSLLCIIVLTGCGGSEFEVASAGGKVVCSGKPVSTGTVMLTPIAEGREPGKAAIAGVQSDGTFTLSTYGDQDGAIVGKHRVTYTPPEGGDNEDEDEEEDVVADGAPEKRTQAAPPKDLAQNSCVLAEELIVEVTSDGPNEFTIELVPASGAEQ